MKGIVSALITAGLAALAQAVLQDYAQARRDLGIIQASSADALQAFVGERTIEVQGRVTGYIGSAGMYSLILTPSDGSHLYVRTATLPPGLSLPMDMRMVVRASRPTENSRISAELIAAADLVDAARVDQAMVKAAPKPKPVPAPKAPAPRTPAPTVRPAATQTSRSADRTTRPAEAPVPTAFAAYVPIYSDFIRGYNSRISKPTADRIAETIIRQSIRFGVDARLVMALVMTESGFNPQAKSHAGARGLGQLMPGTARMLGVSNSYDTEQNLYGTVKLLRQHLDKYGKRTNDDFEALVLSLAAYNAGPGAVSRHGGVPPFRETQNYVRKVTERYRELIGQ